MSTITCKKDKNGVERFREKGKFISRQKAQQAGVTCGSPTKAKKTKAKVEKTKPVKSKAKKTKPVKTKVVKTKVVKTKVVKHVKPKKSEPPEVPLKRRTKKSLEEIPLRRRSTPSPQFYTPPIDHARDDLIDDAQRQVEAYNVGLSTNEVDDIAILASSMYQKYGGNWDKIILLIMNYYRAYDRMPLAWEIDLSPKKTQIPFPDLS